MGVGFEQGGAFSGKSLPGRIEWREGGGLVEERQELCEQLDTVDTTLTFLVVVVVSVLLSLWATLRQREAVRLALEGEDAAAREVGEVYPIRAVAGAFVLGALGYFFWLALRLWEDGRCGASRSSAWANVWASALVLSAAIVRWRDLKRSWAMSRREDLEQELTQPTLTPDV